MPSGSFGYFCREFGLPGIKQFMQPATVKKWHTRVFHFYWRWKSKRGSGRPRISKEMRDLIHTLSRENPLWSAERIRDTLRLLGFSPPSSDTIRRYMTRSNTPPDKTTGWLPFMHNHLDASWAIDFLTVITLNFSFLYVFVVFEHGRRKVVHFATTYHPSMAWVIQQLREAMPFVSDSRNTYSVTTMLYMVTAFPHSWTAVELKKCARLTGVPGRIHMLKGFLVRYDENCLITL